MLSSPSLRFTTFCCSRSQPPETLARVPENWGRRSSGSQAPASSLLGSISRASIPPIQAAAGPQVPTAALSTASEVVREFYDGVNRRDLASVEPLIAEGCVYEDLVFSRPFVGRKAILEFFKKFTESISEDLQFVIDDISCEDTSAVGVTWHLDWQGKPFPFSKGCSFYRLELLDSKRQIVYARDCVEPATKPGEAALDGCIVCPTTDSTFDLMTGEIKDWYPKNPVLRVLTPSLRKLFIYPVKTDAENIYISMRGNIKSGGSAEIVFSGRAAPGATASDVNVEEVRMVVDESQEGFGFTGKNELINGKAAIIGFLLLIDFELLTGKGLLKGTGFLDFIYAASKAFSSS